MLRADPCLSLGWCLFPSALACAMACGLAYATQNCRKNVRICLAVQFSLLLSLNRTVRLFDFNVLCIGKVVQLGIDLLCGHKLGLVPV